MATHVDLNRRFRDLSSKELEQLHDSLDVPGVVDWLGDGDFPRSDGWAELLRHHRILLLAEAGSGKTAEMREQAKRLRQQNKVGLFLDLVSVERQSLADLMSKQEERLFSTWMSDGDSEAWFFLDSV